MHVWGPLTRAAAFPVAALSKDTAAVCVDHGDAICCGLLALFRCVMGPVALQLHYRFGARTGGAPIMIDLFVIMALVLGELGLHVTLIPNSSSAFFAYSRLELCP